MSDLSDLLPHAGTARMIERVVAWDATSITTATSTHRAPGNPLRSDGRLASVHLIEYGAQTMALHGGLRERERGLRALPALLVSVRDFRAARAFIDDLPGDLLLVARVLLTTPASWQYEFEARHEGAAIASGRVAAIARPVGHA
jgi:predicted hotdog family 3-hydroxylacyl-ACP dehydratase